METLVAESKQSESIDQRTVDVSDENFVSFEQEFADGDQASVLEKQDVAKQGAFRKIGEFGLKVAKGETIGTIVDVATIAAGVPLPVRELTGSAIDYKIYGEEDAGHEDKERTKKKRIRKAMGTVALYSVSGIIAQKYGSEVAGAMRDSLNDGTMGMYVTPLVAKLGAVFGVNTAVNKLSR